MQTLSGKNIHSDPCLVNSIYYHLSLEDRTTAYAKTKAQISCAVTAQLISTFVYATWIVQSLFFLNPKFKLLVIFFSCTGRFALDLVGNPKDRIATHLFHIDFICIGSLVTCITMLSLDWCESDYFEKTPN